MHEAAKFAGGRCRTYYDSVIDLDIDNGNHLLLSGNWAALAYLRRIGGLGAMTEAERADFPFADLADRRALDAPAECRPPALVDPRFAPPRAGHARAGLSCADLGVLRAPAADDRRRRHGVQRPALRAALAAGAARGAEHRAGRSGCAARRADPARDARRRRPGLPPDGGDRRAVGRLHRSGARATSREHGGGDPPRPFAARDRSSPASAPCALDFGDEKIALGAGRLASCSPCRRSSRARCIPGLTVPETFHAIVNAHFRIAPPQDQPLDPRRSQRHDGMALRLSRTGCRSRSAAPTG